MTLAWNIVTKHIRPHAQLQDKIREKISKLEQHLQHFPPDAVHLLISLERHPKTERFTAALTLRVPSNILHSEKEAKDDPVPAFDKAIKALLRELEDFKAELRHEEGWRRKGRRVGLHVMKPLRFTETPHPTGPTSLADILAEMIKRYHGRLLYHVERQLQRDQNDGEIPRDSIKAEAVVDEVVRQALSAPGKKPDDISYRMWLYSLVRRELKRRYRELRMDGARNVSLEEMTPLADINDADQDYGAQQPPEIMEVRLEPPLASWGDLLVDTSHLSPDAVAAEHDLIDFLHQATVDWPEKERAVFDLHFLEGFDVDEVALLEGLRPPQAAEMIAAVQSRLRTILFQAAERWVGTKSQPAARGQKPDARPRVTAAADSGGAGNSPPASATA